MGKKLSMTKKQYAKILLDKFWFDEAGEYIDPEEIFKSFSQHNELVIELREAREQLIKYLTT
jgi:hypothetical protein